MKLFVKNKKFKNQGFTLIEVMVNVVIFGIMMSISFYNYPKLTQALAFSNAAQEIVSIVKSAQISGSSRGGSYSGDGVFFSRNGITFTEFLDATSTLDYLGTLKSDRVFSTSTDPSDLISKINTVQNNVKVSDICVKNTSSSKKCGVNGVNNFSVTFVRPSIAANMTDYSETFLGSGIYNFFDKGYIELLQTGPGNYYKKCIVIYNYGQVETKSGECSFQP